MEEPHSSGADDVLRAGGWSQAIIACPHSNCMRRNLRVQERSDHSMPSFELHAAKPPGTREERQDAFSGVLGDGRGGTGAWVEHGRYTMACAAAQAVAATSIRMSGGAPVVVTTIGHSLTELRGTDFGPPHIPHLFHIVAEAMPRRVRRARCQVSGASYRIVYAKPSDPTRYTTQQ